MRSVLTKILYGATGLFLLGAGLSLILVRSGWLPQSIVSVVPPDGGAPGVHHVFQEFGALMTAMALLSFWFIRDFERRRPFHFAMIVFWTIMTWLHWSGWFSSEGSVLYPVLNAVPLLLYLLTLKHRSL